jgi:hypothetical protein
MNMDKMHDGTPQKVLSICEDGQETSNYMSTNNFVQVAYNNSSTTAVCNKAS